MDMAKGFVFWWISQREMYILRIKSSISAFDASNVFWYSSKTDCTFLFVIELERRLMITKHCLTMSIPYRILSYCFILYLSFQITTFYKNWYVWRKSLDNSMITLSRIFQNKIYSHSIKSIDCRVSEKTRNLYIID